MAETLRVLGVFPHPDDESYSCAGTFARLAAGGAVVSIVCATAGEGGQDLRDPPAGSDSGDDLGAVRAAELDCSCRQIGATPPRLLGLPDGGLMQADFAEVAGRLIAEIRTARPHIVVTLGP